MLTVCECERVPLETEYHTLSYHTHSLVQLCVYSGCGYEYEYHSTINTTPHHTHPYFLPSICVAVISKVHTSSTRRIVGSPHTLGRPTDRTPRSEWYCTELKPPVTTSTLPPFYPSTLLLPNLLPQSQLPDPTDRPCRRSLPPP